MNRFLFALLTLFVTTGCSTVEKRGYFYPDVDIKHKVGPKKPDCGWMNFGGLPDTYVSSENENELTVSAYQYFHPYLWGPWFASIVPVFPLTWITELFINDELEIFVRINNKVLSEIETPGFSITSLGETQSMLMPSSVKPHIGESSSFTVKFPVDYGDIDKFVFHISSRSKSVETADIVFVKTSRWSWTQWSPNC